MTLRATFICLLALSCTKGEGSSSAPEKTAWTPVLQARLEQFQGQGLPPVDEGELQNVRELLESSRLGGRLGKMAQRSLDDFSNEKLCSILLDWVEDRFDNSPLSASVPCTSRQTLLRRPIFYPHLGFSMDFFFFK